MRQGIFTRESWIFLDENMRLTANEHQAHGFPYITLILHKTKKVLPFTVSCAILIGIEAPIGTG